MQGYTIIDQGDKLRTNDSENDNHNDNTNYLKQHCLKVQLQELYMYYKYKYNTYMCYKYSM